LFVIGILEPKVALEISTLTGMNSGIRDSNRHWRWVTAIASSQKFATPKAIPFVVCGGTSEGP
jgi:hypothetical protein